MLRVDRKGKLLQSLIQRSLPEAGWKERQDLQQMIRNSPTAFFNEMGEKLFLVGEEIRPTDVVEDRIDLLAIDEQGAAVIIELKRGTNKLQLLQGITYAAMISKWAGNQIIEERQKLAEQTQEEAETEIEEFLLEDGESLNSSQRIILMAEDFDYEVLVAAEWMSEKYEMDIRCFRIKLSVEANTEYLSCTCIYPPPEITGHVRRRGRSGNRPLKWNDWDAALDRIKNKAVVEFCRQELASGRENYLRKRILHYRINGHRRVWISARTNAAYVWQNRRFEGDQEFWLERMGPQLDIAEVKKKSGLRFFLSSAEDFRRFLDAFKKDLPNVQFLGRLAVPDEPEDEDDDEDGDNEV